jgi:protein gp37
MPTKIEWCEETWNPVTGCTKVSAGCKHCYAEAVAKRFWGERKFGDVLRQVPAAVRFLSVEPLLGPIDRLPLQGIDWLIIGGESGPRPCNVSWVRSLLQQGEGARVPVFIKQLGSRTESVTDHISYRGSQTDKPNGFYRFLNDSKGGDMSEWPEDLRVRQWPTGGQ